jgi:hypothetical protein
VKALVVASVGVVLYDYYHNEGDDDIKVADLKLHSPHRFESSQVVLLRFQLVSEIIQSGLFFVFLLGSRHVSHFSVVRILISTIKQTFTITLNLFDLTTLQRGKNVKMLTIETRVSLCLVISLTM